VQRFLVELGVVRAREGAWAAVRLDYWGWPRQRRPKRARLGKHSSEDGIAIRERTAGSRMGYVASDGRRAAAVHDRERAAVV